MNGAYTRIRNKFYLAITAMFPVGLSMFGATAFITSEQESDGLILNLASRQRMLSQKLAEEGYAAAQLSHNGGDGAAVISQLQTTAKLFEKTWGRCFRVDDVARQGQTAHGVARANLQSLPVNSADASGGHDESGSHEKSWGDELREHDD